MIEIRPARADEAPSWRALWQMVFGDGDALLDSVSRCCPPNEMVLLLEDGVLRSMLALPLVEVALPGGDVATGGYVYALATHPAARGRGHALALLCWVDAHLSARGIDCVTVVPAQPSLHQFFATAGFVPCFASRVLTMDSVNLPEAEGVAERLTPEGYNALRRKLLSGIGSVQYPDRLIAFQQGMSALSGGGLYRLVVDGVEGCATVERGAETMVVKELLIPQELTDRAAATLLARHPAVHCQVRTPVPGQATTAENVRPFGMVKWLTPDWDNRWGGVITGYMGLGFD